MNHFDDALEPDDEPLDLDEIDDSDDPDPDDDERRNNGTSERSKCERCGKEIDLDAQAVGFRAGDKKWIALHIECLSEYRKSLKG